MDECNTRKEKMNKNENMLGKFKVALIEIK